MILRRLMKHIRDQNWFAVGLDLAIVVVGVFLGFQVTAWNDARADREALGQALARFEAEIDANLATISETAEELDVVLPEMSNAIDVLRACQAGQDAEAAITTAINHAALTRGMRFRRSALRELTEQPRLLSQQTETQRRALQTLLYDLEVFEIEAAYLERIPFENTIWRFDAVTTAPLRTVTVPYRGYEVELRMRTLELAIPPEEACQQNALIANLYEWERLQSGLRAFLSIATARLTEAKAMIPDTEGAAP